MPIRSTTLVHSQEGASSVFERPAWIVLRQARRIAGGHLPCMGAPDDAGEITRDATGLDLRQPIHFEFEILW